MKKLSVLMVFILLALLAANCNNKSSADSRESDQKKKEKPVNNKDASEKKDADTEAVPVQVVQPARGDISSFLLFSSNVDSEKMVDIYPLTSGIIEKINWDEGDQVGKGAVLAVLDDREASLNEEKAKINFQQIKMEFDRQEEIYKKELISKEEYEKLKYRLENALLDWKQQQLLLSYTRITSPISGVVSKRYIKVGNKITTNQLAFSVVNTREKIAVVNIPGQEREQIFLKQTALIKADPYQVQGFVKRVSPAIDPESGTFKVTVEIDDQKDLLAVGQFVNVKIVKKVHKNAVLLTKDALIYDGGKIFVFVVDEDNKAVKKLIKTGFEDGSRIEVVEGLTESDRVVTAGKSSLKSKTLVKIIEAVIS